MAVFHLTEMSGHGKMLVTLATGKDALLDGKVIWFMCYPEKGDV